MSKPDRKRPIRLVLIVDDEPEIAEMLEEIVEGEHCRACIAGNGHAALALCARYDFDLVLTDLVMPDLDGPAFYRALCVEHPELARRTVFMTGDTLSQSAQRFLAEARRPVIEKPFLPADVRALLRRAAEE